jgi:poly(hydroxyalkanoate) depolymerase family esterase
MAIHAASAALAALLAVSGGDGAKTAGPAAIPRGFQDFAGAGTVLPLDKVFVPTDLTGKVPLVVVLHGCQQDADSIAAVTRWNELAEKEKFMVLYPNQQWGRNPYNCWNWFLPINQAAGVGEPAEIAAAVEAAVLEYPVDPRRVFVTGISAGGAEAATLLSCYPALFAAGAVHSGVAYGVAATASDALAVMKDGPAGRPRAGWCDPSAYRGGVFVVHGSSDAVIAPSNADRTASDFSGASVKKLIVPGLGHAWSGGAPGLPYSDPRGPDATGLMWAFFSRFR